MDTADNPQSVIVADPSMDSDERRLALQALSPDILQRLDPQYVSFHNQCLRDSPVHELLEDLPRLRLRPAWFAAGDLPAVEVGRIEVISIEQGRVEITVFLPEKSLQGEKRPGMVWFHAGGFALGNPSSEVGWLTRMCKAIACVIFSVKYRLAPEDPFPAAVGDGTAALHWISTRGAERYNIDKYRIGIGGVSAGANLATVTALKDARAKAALKVTEANAAPPLVFQLLIVPLVDNAATEDNILRKANHGAPGPAIKRLLDYQRHYVPTPKDGQNWQASPIRLPLTTLREWPVPKTYIAVAEVDPLFQEGLKYGRLLERAGVAVTVHIVKGAPHMIANLGGVMEKGRELLHQVISWVAEQFRVPLEEEQP